MNQTAARGYNEGNQRCNIFRFAEVCDSKLVQDSLCRLLQANTETVAGGFDASNETIGSDETRIDTIDLNAIVNTHFGQHLGERQNRRVHRSANCEQNIRRSTTDTGYIYDGSFATR